ncbi:MAG: putative molybdopterin biosynthesis protein [Saprospiraceae bacterium]|jgi:putative molybdopterin biosynthesis protein
MDTSEDFQVSPFLNVKQVALYVQLNEKKIYELANLGIIPATKVTGKWMFPRELIDHWMLDSSHSGLLSERLIIGGSDDPLLYRIVNDYVAQTGSQALVTYSPTGTRLGLELMQAHRVDVCGIHWGPDTESDTRHPALLRHYSEHVQWVLIRAFRREQGLILTPKLAIGDVNIESLLGPNTSWAMRQPGSGAQRFIQEVLSRYGKTSESLNQSNQSLSEREAAANVAMGMADVAPGTRAIASEFNLGFISLGWEAFDLAIPRKIWFRHLFQGLNNQLKSLKTQSIADQLSGYDLSESGELIWGDD